MVTERSWLKRRRSLGATVSVIETMLESWIISPAALRTNMRGEVLGRGALSGVELDDDVILLAADLEAGHLAAAQHGLEGAADLRHVESQIGDAVAVDLYLELRLVELEIGIEIDHCLDCSPADRASRRCTSADPHRCRKSG